MAPPKPADRDGFHIAVICALQVEAKAVEALFDTFYRSDEYKKAKNDTNSYTLGTIGEHNVVLAHMSSAGKAIATKVASKLGSSFTNIKLGLVVGVCGGVPKTHEGKQILLGDVIISTALVEYDLVRQNPQDRARKDTVEESLGRPKEEVRAFLAKIMANRDDLENKTATYLEALLPQPGLEGSRYPGAHKNKLFQPAYRHKHHNACPSTSGCNEVGTCHIALHSTCKDLHCDDEHELVPGWGRGREGAEAQKCAIHFGLVASGDTVMKSGEHRDKIADDENVIAFEMEGVGVWEEFGTVVIKGVCDYSDSHKNSEWQPYAAATAVACTKACLEEWVLSDPESNQTAGGGYAISNVSLGQHAKFNAQGSNSKSTQQDKDAVYMENSSYHKTGT